MVAKHPFGPELSIFYFSLLFAVYPHREKDTIKKLLSFQNFKAADTIQLQDKDLSVSNIQLTYLQSSSLGYAHSSEAWLLQDMMLHQLFLKVICFLAMFFFFFSSLLLSCYFTRKTLLCIHKIKCLKIMTIKTLKSYFNGHHQNMYFRSIADIT